MGKINYIATGVIDHSSYSDGKSDQNCEWEKNFDSIFKDRTDNYLYLFEEVCKSLDIDFKKFIVVTDKIFKQMGAFNDEITKI